MITSLRRRIALALIWLTFVVTLGQVRVHPRATEFGQGAWEGAETSAPGTSPDPPSR